MVYLLPPKFTHGVASTNIVERAGTSQLSVIEPKLAATKMFVGAGASQLTSFE